MNKERIQTHTGYNSSQNVYIREREREREGQNEATQLLEMRRSMTPSLLHTASSHTK
jgi:hypothetical protein